MSTSTISSGDETGCIEVQDGYVTFEWSITNFSLLPQGIGDNFWSPDFNTVNNQGKCYLNLYPQGANRENAGYVAIFLHIVPSGVDATFNTEINAELSILASGITKKLKFTCKDSTDYNSGCMRFIQRSKLLELCASDDKVTIRCRISIPWDKTKCTEQAFDLQEGQLSQAFRLLFTEPMLNDVTVIVGNRSFPAHKLVLATRSPVFSAMFQNKETQENLTNEVKIEQMEPAIVESMLEFFYTDEVANLEEQAYGLLEAADKYDVGRLRIMCEKILYKKLNTENAAEILIHSDLHNSHKLKEHVMEYMDNHLADVVEMESYREMEKNHPALILELMRSIAARKKTTK